MCDLSFICPEMSWKPKTGLASRIAHKTSENPAGPQQDYGSNAAGEDETERKHHGICI